MYYVYPDCQQLFWWCHGFEDEPAVVEVHTKPGQASTVSLWLAAGPNLFIFLNCFIS